MFMVELDPYFEVVLIKKALSTAIKQFVSLGAEKEG